MEYEKFMSDLNNLKEAGFWVEDTIEDVYVTDMVNSPAHYTKGGQEAIVTIEDAIAGAPGPITGMLQGNTLKYLIRLWDKGNAIQDAKKARWYLDRLIDKLEGNVNNFKAG